MIPHFQSPVTSNATKRGSGFPTAHVFALMNHFKDEWFQQAEKYIHWLKEELWVR